MISHALLLVLWLCVFSMLIRGVYRLAVSQTKPEKPMDGETKTIGRIHQFWLDDKITVDEMERLLESALRGGNPTLALPRERAEEIYPEQPSIAAAREVAQIISSKDPNLSTPPSERYVRNASS